MKKIILIVLLVLVGGYLYFNDNRIKEPNTINQENKLNTEEKNEDETQSAIQTEVKNSSGDKNITTPADILNYELEDGEHFVFVTDYGVENGEPFVIFDKIQANLTDSNNFPLFSNDNTLKRKLFLSRGSAYLGTADEVKEDYWFTKSISSLGGQRLFEPGNEQNNITNFINKNNILVITVADNKIWSIRYTNLDSKLNRVINKEKLEDGSYDGYYVNFIKIEGGYYLTFDTDETNSVSLKVDEASDIKMYNFGGLKENMTIEEFRKIAFDFERAYYRVSVEVKDNLIENIAFYMRN